MQNNLFMQNNVSEEDKIAAQKLKSPSLGEGNEK